MDVLSDLQPKRVFYYFEQLSRIPRGSGKEAAAADFCVKFAEKSGFYVKKDAANNVIIRKPGTAGLETAPTVILQGHLDMVCEKNNDTQHDFAKDPLDLYVDGDFVKARGTTLGADNGIAVAMCLALLESGENAHPPLEAVFTTGEEVGLLGASALDPSNLTGSYVINMDTEEEGIFVASCAGGVRADVSVPIRKTPPTAALSAFKLSVCGLKGGHSGMEIDKGRGNANKILGRILYELSDKVELSIIDIRGGLKDNAIPREAEAIFAANAASFPKISEIVNKFDISLKKEFRVFDGLISISVEKQNAAVVEIFDEKSTKSAILALNLIKNGVFAMSGDVAGLVETSSNLGVVRVKDDSLVLTSAVRSSVATRKKSVVNGLKCVASAFGGSVTLRGDYPSWEFEPDPTFRNKFVAVYESLYGKTPKIDAIHAGLEPGCFAEKIKAEMISIGPDMFDVHTPDERLSISSVQRFWEFFLTVLGTLS